jgi:hypothetical protein
MKGKVNDNNGIFVTFAPSLPIKREGLLMKINAKHEFPAARG